jgi:benzoyl-CoA reductase/2-hydroxyglutaryl-CoA dehydratase subunit BcrC/BadD/HgdB
MSGCSGTQRDPKLNIPLFEEMHSFEMAKYKRMILDQENRPKNMSYFDHAVHESHLSRVDEIIEAKKTGTKMIGTFCIYVPEEIVYAASAIPVALCGGTSFSIHYAERKFPRDICPLIKSTLGLAFSRTCPYAALEDMGVGETTCDAKKKTWDILSQKSRFHVIELPQKKNHCDAGLWRAEVGEFRKAVEDLTGNKVTFEKLYDSVMLLNRKRKLLGELNESRKNPLPPISGRDSLVVMQMALNDEPNRFCDNLRSLIDETRIHAKNKISPFPQETPRIMVTGCPSVMGNWKMHHLIETSGAVVVCDESCTGTRYFENIVDERGKTAEHLIDAIADRYFKINCSCFTPNNERIKHVVELAKEYSADGVIQYILQYCHSYNIEAMRITEALKNAGIPSIIIETDYGDEDEGQLRTRVEALLERVKN